MIHQETPEFSEVKSSVRIFLVKLEDNGNMGKRIGCGDSLVPLGREVPILDSIIESTLQELLSLKEESFDDQGLYNALARSDLAIDDVIIKDSHAIIKLRGKLVIGGVCDGPRVEEQIKETVLQFPNISSVEIFINEKSLHEVLSGRGE